MELSSEIVKVPGKERKLKLFIPHEVIIEILSRLPVNSLQRLQPVSKHWYSTVNQDSKFIIQHQHRARTITYFYNEGDGFELESYTSNLILERNNASKKYRIRNPFTRQILHLPDPHGCSYRMILFKVQNCSTDYFKAISISRDESSNIGFEVVTLSEDEQWRPLRCPKLPPLPGHITVIQIAGLVVHFIWYDTVGDMKVESLEVESECFYTSTLPQGFFSSFKKVYAIPWSRRLGIVGIVNDDLNAIILEDYKKQKWSENKIVIPLSFLKEYPDLKGNLDPYWATENKLWFHVNNDWDKVLVYSTELGKIIKYKEYANDGSGSCLKMKENLVNLKGMQSLTHNTFSNQPINSGQPEPKWNFFSVFTSFCCCKTAKQLD